MAVFAHTFVHNASVCALLLNQKLALYKWPVTYFCVRDRIYPRIGGRGCSPPPPQEKELNTPPTPSPTGGASSCRFGKRPASLLCYVGLEAMNGWFCRVGHLSGVQLWTQLLFPGCCWLAWASFECCIIIAIVHLINAKNCVPVMISLQQTKVLT